MRRPLGSWVRAVAGVTALLGGAVSPLHAQGPKEKHPEVKSVSLRGVHHVDATLLQQSIATQASGCRSLLLEPFCWITHSHYFYQRRYLDHTEFQRDVLRIKVFYWERGYRDTQVDTSITPSGGGVKVRFAITEGPPTVLTRLEVVRPPTLLSDKDMQHQMVLRAGDPLNLLKLDSSIVRLRDAMWERGYADAVISTPAVTVDTAAHTAQLSMTIDPRWRTTIGSITVAGNKKIATSTILHSLTFGVGDIYRRSDLITSQRNLYQSNLFRRAAIVVPPKGDSAKQIEVSVEEAPLQDARLSGGFNTVDYAQVEARFTDYNLLGGARRLDVDGVIGNLLASALSGQLIFYNLNNRSFGGFDVAPFLQPTWNASVNVTQPWLSSPNNSFGVGLFAHRRAQPGAFIDRGYGGDATFTRTVAERAPISLDYRYEVTRVEAGDVYFCVNYGVCDQPTISGLRAHSSLSPLALTGNVDRSNDPFSPTQGYRADAALEYASQLTLSDFRYYRAMGEASAYYSVTRHSVLAAHVRLGYVHPLGHSGAQNYELHPRKRFYAGGATSVRGYGENELGPRVLTVPPSKLGQVVGCDTTSAAAVEQCNPNGPLAGNAQATLKDRDFTPRPTGGTSLLEGSVEWRFPIWKQLGGAAFVDAGLVGESGLAELAVSGNGAVTPGFGFRYYSPVGPIRVDFGYNPGISEDLPVVTQVLENGQLHVVTLSEKRTYNPTASGRGLLGAITNHLTLHLAIGQAY